MILVIDNYDSFTWNLVHLVGRHGVPVKVVRNDDLRADEALNTGAQGIILSPGPCTPDDAGICVEVAKRAKARGLPLLGVCLGHQSIVSAAGGQIVRAPHLMHGRTSVIERETRPDPLFDHLPRRFKATRYHSLSADAGALPADIRVLAHAADDGEIMAVRWGDAPVWGVQYHPESIASEGGDALMAAFLASTEQAAA